MKKQYNERRNHQQYQRHQWQHINHQPASQLSIVANGSNGGK